SNSQIYEDTLFNFKIRIPQFSKYDLTNDVQIYSYDFTDIIRKYKILKGDSIWFERNMSRSGSLKTEYFGAQEIEIATPLCTKVFGNKFHYPFSFLRPIMDLSIVSNPTYLYNSFTTSVVVDANFFLNLPRNPVIGYRALTKLDSIIFKYKMSDLKVDDFIVFGAKRFPFQKQQIGDTIYCKVNGIDIDESYTNDGKGNFKVQFTHLTNQNQQLTASFDYTLQPKDKSMGFAQSYVEVKSLDMKAAHVAYDIKNRNQILGRTKKQIWPIIINNLTFGESSVSQRSFYTVPKVWFLIEKPLNDVEISIADKTSNKMLAAVNSNDQFILFEATNLGALKDLELIAESENCNPYSINVFMGSTLDTFPDFFDYYIQNRENALGKFSLNVRKPLPFIQGVEKPFSKGVNCLGGGYVNKLFNFGSDSIVLSGLHIFDLQDLNYKDLSIAKNGVFVSYTIVGDSIFFNQNITLLKGKDSLEIVGDFAIKCQSDPKRILRVHTLSLSPCNDYISDILSLDTLFSPNNSLVAHDIDVKVKEISNIKGIRTIEAVITPMDLLNKGTRIDLFTDIKNIIYHKDLGLKLTVNDQTAYFFTEKDTREPFVIRFDFNSEELCGDQCDTLYLKITQSNLLPILCDPTCSIYQNKTAITHAIPTSYDLRQYKSHDFTYQSGQINYIGLVNDAIAYEDTLEVLIFSKNPSLTKALENPVLLRNQSIAKSVSGTTISATFNNINLPPCTYFVMLTSRYGCDTITGSFEIEADTLTFSICDLDTLNINLSSQNFIISDWSNDPFIFDKNIGSMKYYNTNLLDSVVINSSHIRLNGCAVNIPLVVYPLKFLVDKKLIPFNTYDCTDSAKTYLDINQLTDVKTIWVNQDSFSTDREIPLPSGPNNLTLMTIDGCTVQTNLLVTTPFKPQIRVLNTTPTICDENSGIIDFFVLASQTYSITFNGDTIFNTQFSNLSSGNYFIRAQN
ncbi:MAG TPA: hypothetical protein PKD85_08510, partial [Saprospiraceae bacterium]|nr:hypothetical protein [Saprospiraceae bacterium]